VGSILGSPKASASKMNPDQIKNRDKSNSNLKNKIVHSSNIFALDVPFGQNHIN